MSSCTSLPKEVATKCTMDSDNLVVSNPRHIAVVRRLNAGSTDLHYAAHAARADLAAPIVTDTLLGCTVKRTRNIRLLQRVVSYNQSVAVTAGQSEV